MIFLAWCFFLHFVGDFLLQSRWMAENKSKSLKALGAHIGVLFLVFLVGTLSPLLALGNAVVHMAIDATTWNVYGWLRRREDRATFAFWKDHLFWTTLGLDQLLHGLTILAVVEYLR